MSGYDAIWSLGIGVVFLVAGVGIGLTLRRSGEVQALSLIEKVTAHCASQLTSTTALTKEAQGLSDTCSQHQPPLPEHILRGADAVARASSSLQEQMASLNSLMVVFQQSRNSTDRASPPAEERSPLRGWTASSEQKLLQERRATPERRKSAGKLCFDLWQYIAPYDGTEHPSPSV